MKAVYITGCYGLIGGHVTIECLKKGWKVRGIDKITYAANEKLWRPKFEKFGDNFEFIESDITKLDYLPYCDYVINTAAETHVCNSISSSHEFMHSNVMGVYNLLESIKNKKQYKKPILLHLSTDETMGDCEIDKKYDESCLLNPSNPYSASKACADMLILAWARTYGVPYVIVRPSNNYGIGQYVEKLIPLSCKNLALGKKIPLHLNGIPKRTWLHADDTAMAIVKIIEQNIENEIFNISGDEEYQNIEVVERIINEFFKNPVDIKEYVDTSYQRDGIDLRYRIDDSKIRKMLNWAPKQKLFDNLPQIVQYYKENFIW